MPATITNDDVSIFITLVDEAERQAPPASAAENTDPSEANPHRGSEKLYGQIHAILMRGDDKPGPNIRQLQGALTKRAVLDPGLSEYRDTVRRLRNGASSDKRFLDFQDRDAWIAAIRLVRQLPDSPLPPTLGFEREVAVATAVKKLRDHGYGIDPHDAGFQYREGEMERLCSEVHHLAEEIGGHRLLGGLFAFIQKTTRIEQGRYLISRPSRPPSGGDSTPSFPFGYLLNLVLKHVSAKGRVGDCRLAADALAELATAVVASLDVEHYYILTPMFQTHETLPGFLQELVVADHVLTFRQIAPADALAICRGVFSWIDGDIMRAKLGWGPQDAYRLAEHTLIAVPEDAAQSVFTRPALSSSGLSPLVLDSMQQYFAHNPRGINAAYLTPLDADKTNASSKPFVAMPDGGLMMVSPSTSSIGFYEAIASGARAAFGNADEKIGNAMESMVAAAFRARNILPSVVSGKYKVGADTHECDLVIESDSVLILIELKKKALTAASYAGNTVSALLDLCLSAMDAQLQLGKHELRLRETGRIEFLDGTVVELRARRIERLAVSLLDWGGTQDRLVLQRIAANLVGARLSASGLTSRQGDHLDSANETLSGLQVQRARLEQLGIEPPNQFHNWWFLSIPQLLFVLKPVTGPEAFYADLRLVRQVHSGTMDFYRDLAHWRRARDQVARSSGPEPK